MSLYPIATSSQLRDIRSPHCQCWVDTLPALVWAGRRDASRHSNITASTVVVYAAISAVIKVPSEVGHVRSAWCAVTDQSGVQYNRRSSSQRHQLIVCCKEAIACSWISLHLTHCLLVCFFALFVVQVQSCHLCCVPVLVHKHVQHQGGCNS